MVLKIKKKGEDEMDFSTVKEGGTLTYIGNSLAFGGSYKVVTAESTYLDPSQCPDEERGQLMIIEFMNDDTPMFFMVNQLDPKEWKVV